MEKEALSNGTNVTKTLDIEAIPLLFNPFNGKTSKEIVGLKNDKDTTYMYFASFTEEANFSVFIKEIEKRICDFFKGLGYRINDISMPPIREINMSGSVNMLFIATLGV
jgi:hypothetical protein